MRPHLAHAMERDFRSIRTPRGWMCIAMALAMALTSCAGGGEAIDPTEVESLREQVSALTEQDAARTQRLEELETTTARLSRTSPLTRVTEAEREIAGLVDALALLDEELAAAVTANEQRDAAAADTAEELTEQNAAVLEANEQLQGTVSELRSRLDTALGRIDRVSGEIEDLEIRYLTLRDRLDRVSP